MTERLLNRKNRRLRAFTLPSLVVLAGCGGAPLTSRYVDTPKSTGVEYGAPAATQYEVEIEPEHESLRLYLYQYSECPRIPVTVVHRQEELLRGDEVVETKQIGPVQIAQPPDGTVPCEAGYGRDVDVSLLADGASYDLGRTDSYGYLSVDLASVLQRGTRDGALPSKAEIRIRPPYGGAARVVGEISLAQLEVHEQQVEKLLGELDSILMKGSSFGPEDISRSYVLYEKLRQLAPLNARFRAAAARFWELFFDRKRDEATERLGRNLKALDAAKDLLRSAGLAAIPIYVRAAANSGAVDPRAVEWSQWEVLSAVRAHPAVCRVAFEFENLDGYGLSPSSRFALRYLQFSHGDGFSRSIDGLCGRLAAR